jgi:hypothetical protein
MEREFNSESPGAETDRILAICGYVLVGLAVLSFGAIVFLKVHQYLNPRPGANYGTFSSFLQSESPTLFLLLIGYIAVSKGRSLITTVRQKDVRAVPADDYALVRDAVIKGQAEPIDQYLRLRSLSGLAGNFTKLQITGLPLTTVFLTLVFAAVALIPLADTTLPGQFLDLAKLTLGAFIGSFVQGRVEQRKQQRAEEAGKPAASLPPV